MIGRSKMFQIKKYVQPMEIILINMNVRQNKHELYLLLNFNLRARTFSLNKAFSRVKSSFSALRALRSLDTSCRIGRRQTLHE